MTKWEYFTAPVLSHVAQQILNNFGSEGWELVQLAPGPAGPQDDGYGSQRGRHARSNTASSMSMRGGGGAGCEPGDAPLSLPS